MSTRDLHLIDLYHTPRDPNLQALAARHAPVLYFDANEPFLPLAAGYTVFDADDPSPSMQRKIELRPEGKPPASRAIEYAIWWDWDIHHLYELEHVWVYLDEQERLVRVEGSWHGEYHEIPVKTQDGRAVLLSEPGKHAFAPAPEWFLKRKGEIRRSQTKEVGMYASVLVNDMFRGRIRQRIFDQTLVRTFLVQHAFEPAWDFTKSFTFENDWLVPWPALHEWIPERVNSWLQRLETHTRPASYRALRLMDGGSTLKSLQAAASAGAEAVLLTIYTAGEQVKLGSNADAISLLEAFQFLSTEPMVAFLQPVNLPALERTARFILAKDMEHYAVIISDNPTLLTRYKSLVPGGVTAVQFNSPEQDPLLVAHGTGAYMVNPRWDNLPAKQQKALSMAWIERVHQVGLGIIGWPVSGAEERSAMQTLGVDVVWQAGNSAATSSDRSHP